MGGPKPTPLIERFLRHIEILENGCWKWTGQLSQYGYGRFRVSASSKGRKRVQAHKFSYEWFVGPIPDGMEPDHTCHNPENCNGGIDCPHRACVNYEHLEPVSRRVNQIRGNSPIGKNSRRTHCAHGHLLEGDNLLKTALKKYGWRQCRECNLRMKRDLHERQRAA